MWGWESNHFDGTNMMLFFHHLFLSNNLLDLKTMVHFDLLISSAAGVTVSYIKGALVCFLPNQVFGMRCGALVLCCVSSTDMLKAK